ncbi:pyridoxamine 5'-phosphate oxidase family protein [Teichococcus vastitatis]|jgi:general stress protein 26|uniref:Pyridoxamine 5'-phosphate oxidase family protein n=1 Tax=Teichococcus vastitatis TaxID=2307076 RepID=A0ABS9W5H7_9PROT|nr:pyridoxamine 5'-phosphate oxidase family protein [Pseudoroseomonas vastitatis]MCI0754548.1 pyridoxamine 5'-phosphate oxidase family protein [Pseudoroseomonas vastitatis]
MPQKTVSDLSQRMREIDVCMLNTHTEGGAIASRPMSNNKDVDYNGQSFYFSYGDARTISDLESNPQVTLSFQGPKRFAIAIEGRAELIRDKAAFREHWTPELDKWFDQGIDTPGIVLIRVEAERIHYWDGTEQGELTP